jgi:hypothetical protein
MWEFYEEISTYSSCNQTHTKVADTFHEDLSGCDRELSVVKTETVRDDVGDEAEEKVEHLA